MGRTRERARPKPGSFAADATVRHQRLKPCELVINKPLAELIGNTAHRYFSGRKLNRTIRNCGRHHVGDLLLDRVEAITDFAAALAGADPEESLVVLTAALGDHAIERSNYLLVRL
jgi:hypothetical protein